MRFDNFDLVASLQALPETDPIEVNGIQFGGNTCIAQCQDPGTVVVIQTVCVAGTCT